jgi:HEAT repeat protein
MGDRGLWILLVTIAALVVLAFAFGAYTIYLRIRTDRRERRWRVLTAKWEEPILLAVEDPDQVQVLHDLVAPSERLHFVRFILEYSRRVRGEERQILRELAAPYLAPIADRLDSPFSEIRTRAVQTLGTLGLPRYAPRLIDALDDPSPLVAMVAAWSLCLEQNPEYAPAVLRHVERFQFWSRTFVASLLASLGPGAAPVLRTTLRDGRTPPWVRAATAEALRTLDDFDAGDAAAEVVAREHDPELVAAAMRLLTRVGRPEHAEIIRARCASPDYSLRASAIAALGVLGSGDDHPRLLGAMSDPSPWVAIQAARGLVAAGGTALLEDLRDSDHPRSLLAAQVLEEEARE